MGIVFRQSVKTSIVYLAGALLGAAYTYLMARIFIPVHAGITRNLITQAVVLQVFFSLGMPAVIQYYLPRLDQEPQKQKTLLTISLLLPLIAAAVLSIPYFLARSYVVSRYQLQDQVFIDRYYTWVPFFTIAWAYMSTLEVYLFSRMKTAIATFIKEIVLRIVLIGLVILYYFNILDLNGFVIATILGHIIPVAVMLLAAMRTKDFGLSFSLKSFSRQDVKFIISFAWYHLLNGATIYLMGYLDALLLASQSRKGLADSQYYSVAIFFATFLTLPYRSMINAATANINEAYHKNDQSTLQNLFTRTSSNMLIGVLAMWLLIIPNMHNAMGLLNKNYSDISLIVLILSIGKVTDVLTGPNTELIGLSRYYKFLFRITLLLVLAILVFDRIFIPHYGIYAAAWVTSLCTIAYNIIKMIFLYTRMKLQPFSRYTYRILLAAAIAALPAFLLPAVHNVFIDAIYRSAVIIPVYLGALLLFKASPDLNTYLASIRKHKRLF